MVALVLAIALAPPPVDVHGTVVSVDRAHNLVVVHHRAHAGMAMEMEMAVRMRDRSALAQLKPGTAVRLLCDQARNPWVCVRR
jgi:Cu/Ag efflux protein CusF